MKDASEHKNEAGKVFAQFKNCTGSKESVKDGVMSPKDLYNKQVEKITREMSNTCLLLEPCCLGCGMTQYMNFNSNVVSTSGVSNNNVPKGPNPSSS